MLHWPILVKLVLVFRQNPVVFLAYLRGPMLDSQPVIEDTYDKLARILREDKVTVMVRSDNISDMTDTLDNLFLDGTETGARNCRMAAHGLGHIIAKSQPIQSMRVIFYRENHKVTRMIIGSAEFHYSWS